MDGVTEFDPDLVVTEAVGTEDEAAQRQAKLVARMKRKMANQRKRAHAMGMLHGVLSQLGPGSIAVDCGANVGRITRRLAATGATVYAFEPDPVAFEQLQKRCGDMPNVHLIQGAVGTEAGTATLHRSVLFEADPLRGTVGSTLIDGVRKAEAGDASQSIEVPVYDLPAILDDLIAGRDPDGLPSCTGLFRRPQALSFLKLDIEGAELDLLNALHASDTLSKIGCTVVETHERKFPDLRRGFARMRREFARAYAPSQVCLDWV